MTSFQNNDLCHLCCQIISSRYLSLLISLICGLYHGPEIKDVSFILKMAFKIQVRSLHRLSKIFQPLNVIPKDAKIKQTDLTSKSQKVFLFAFFFIFNVFFPANARVGLYQTGKSGLLPLITLSF